MSPDELTTEKCRVAICICTYRRPAVIEHLLQELRSVIRDANSVADVHIVVVDDDANESARGAVESQAGQVEWPISYVVSGSGNISTARNTAVAEGIRVADFLALIDDDCVPHHDWLRQLVAVQQRYGSDIVSGYCIDVAPEGAPRWFVDEPFVTPHTPMDDGASIDNGALKNTLLDASAIRRYNLGFDESYGRTGGEDSMFFYTAAHLGLSHRFASAAVVEERVPPDRATLRYQLRRALWYGNTEATTSIASGRHGRTRIALSSVKRILLAPARPIRRLATGKSSEWRYGLCVFLAGCGRLVGAFGVRLNH